MRRGDAMGVQSPMRRPPDVAMVSPTDPQLRWRGGVPAGGGGGPTVPDGAFYIDGEPFYIDGEPFVID